MRSRLRRLRSVFASDPARGYEWWTFALDREPGSWLVKLGPVTVYDYLGFRGVSVLERCWETERDVFLLPRRIGRLLRWFFTPGPPTWRPPGWDGPL